MNQLLKKISNSSFIETYSKISERNLGIQAELKMLCKRKDTLENEQAGLLNSFNLDEDGIKALISELAPTLAPIRITYLLKMRSSARPESFAINYFNEISHEYYDYALILMRASMLRQKPMELAPQTLNSTVRRYVLCPTYGLKYYNCRHSEVNSFIDLAIINMGKVPNAIGPDNRGNMYDLTSVMNHPSVNPEPIKILFEFIDRLLPLIARYCALVDAYRAPKNYRSKLYEIYEKLMQCISYVSDYKYALKQLVECSMEMDMIGSETPEVIEEFNLFMDAARKLEKDYKQEIAILKEKSKPYEMIISLRDRK